MPRSTGSTPTTECPHAPRRLARVERGEVVGLLGRNSVAKTTTLKAVMGLMRASGGRVDFKGRA